MARDEYFRSALNFLSSNDVISRLVRFCCRFIGFLLLPALAGVCIWIAGLVFGAGAALIGNWIYVIVLPIAGYSLIRFRDLLADSSFRQEILVPVLTVATLLVAAGCSLYTLFLNYAPLLSFLGAIVLYGVLVFLEGWLKTALQACPALLRRLAAAVMRSNREIALTSAVGFAFVLTTQIDVIVWGAFSEDALWIWERLLRPVGLLPKPTVLFVFVSMLSLAVLSALNPRHRLVERGLNAIKVYKTGLAILATLASFTFLASASIDSLHGQLTLQKAPSKSSEEWRRAGPPRTVMTKAAWICYRLESATPEERNRVALELSRLPEANRQGMTLQAAQNMAERLNEDIPSGIDSSPPGNGGIKSTPADPDFPSLQDGSASRSGVDDSDAQKAYAEARQAVTGVLSALIKDRATVLHSNGDLLSSFASDLLASVLTALPDSVLPKNVGDFAEWRDRLKPLWPKRFRHSLSDLRFDLDWDAIRARAKIAIPRWGFGAVFENGGKFATEVFFEPEAGEIARGETKPKSRLRFRNWVRVVIRDAKELR